MRVTQPYQSPIPQYHLQETSQKKRFIARQRGSGIYIRNQRKQYSFKLIVMATDIPDLCSIANTLPMFTVTIGIARMSNARCEGRCQSVGCSLQKLGDASRFERDTRIPRLHGTGCTVPWKTRSAVALFMLFHKVVSLVSLRTSAPSSPNQDGCLQECRRRTPSFLRFPPA